MLRSSAAATSILSGTALVFGLALLLQPAPARAYDDDVDVVCFDYQGSGGGETECQTIEELTAECAVSDPEFSTDVCGGLLENRKPFGLTTASGDKEKKKKHDRGNDGSKGRDQNGGGNHGGGSGNGGNSGGGGSNGGGRGNGGGSGPNG